MFDILIKNGLVVDGTGAKGFAADVAVKDGRIAEIGRINGAAKRTIDAKGRAVAPGFIDTHTHFDVQLLWDGAAKPALEHGVTSIVPGNCSLSLAPLRAADRPAVVGMFQQIEEMPPEAFTIAFDWTWEDFAGYRQAIEPNLSINVAPLVGHSVIRQWVMGPAASERAANPDEIKGMQDLLRECLKAGAIGLSTSYIDGDAKGRPVPSRFAQFEELDALSAVLGEFGRMLQVVPEFYDADITVARIDQLAELSLKHNIPTTFSPVFDNPLTPHSVAKQMARVEEQTARGARVHPQMQTRPVDISFSLLRPSLFFARFPSWYRICKLPVAERTAALRDAETVEKLVAETGPDEGKEAFGELVARGGDAIPAELAGKTLSQIAAGRGETPARALISLSLENGLDVAFVASNRGHNDTSRIGPFLKHPLMHIGASDGGAHLASFATYGDTGYLFSEFVRKSKTFTLEEAVHKITLESAEIWRIPNRGKLAPGWAADIVIFDPDTIARGDEIPAFDMPGDGMRYIRHGVGIDKVLVNGEVAFEDGGYTAAKPGVVVV
jgi:N-acyl-D-aspartate/D-glutamate deacylase